MYNRTLDDYIVGYSTLDLVQVNRKVCCSFWTLNLILIGFFGRFARFGKDVQREYANRYQEGAISPQICLGSRHNRMAL